MIERHRVSGGGWLRHSRAILDLRPPSTVNRGRAWGIGSPTVMWSSSWRRQPLLSGGSMLRSLVTRCCWPGRFGASSTRRVVMPRWMASGSICTASPPSCTACRSKSALPVPGRAGRRHHRDRLCGRGALLDGPARSRTAGSARQGFDPPKADRRGTAGADRRVSVGLRDWIGRDGSRAAIRAALP